MLCRKSVNLSVLNLYLKIRNFILVVMYFILSESMYCTVSLDNCF